MEAKIDKNRRIIWTNEDYNEWRDCVIEDNDLTEDEATYEQYEEDCSIFLDDEKANLDIELDGCIVAFAVLDLWFGKREGAKKVGNYVNNIFDVTFGDYITFYCDRYNVWCEDAHHDGRNLYLFRVAKDAETAAKLVDAIAYKGMTMEQFKKRTKSLRSYVANVYGW